MYHEDDAVRVVESVTDLELALIEFRIGYFVEDDGSDYGVMVERGDDGDVTVRVVEDTTKHAVVCEMVFNVFHENEVQRSELNLLWVVLMRLYGGEWAFYDWAIANLIVEDCTPALTALAWKAEHSEF